jgi:uncharacterized protein YeaO (DUF488 family)
MIRLKRVYEPPSKEDGYRVLVDRLWPRGLSKEKAKADIWMKEIAPSDGLRKWFSHDPARWEEFRERYAKELEKKSGLLKELRALLKEKKTITLLYAAKDVEHNNAVALSMLLGSRH